MKKTILITGAGSGIGKDTTFALSRRGHRVIATTETESQAKYLKAEVLHTKLAIEVFKLDITIASDREKIAAYDLDVLINNAAIGESGSLAEIPMDRVRKNFEVNVFSTLETAQVALMGMLKRHQGTVLFISSVAGRIPIPFLNPYSMTKFALSGGVAALRQEIHRVEKNVHISLIEPGAYATGFNQKMFAKKYQWMNDKSFFFGIIPALKKEENRFQKIEQKSTRSIVSKIVEACEAKKTRLRYVAPWYQGVAIALLRIFGK
jgi:short-subunit dehydrogenase